ncbi:hypothetical protein IFM89_027360 [Coptis chinensis]|uniref:Uncharacterized protein n=1 Tax=Coptis chinensis TaxID=261450 RepID=A0A835LGP6_9MAGN|nr:hypothetical protein IFM89_027360 [Coptis chinensis]
MTEKIVPRRRSILSEAVEQDSGSCESEIRSREENVVSNSEAEVAGLMNRVEFMKKEYFVLWLREFKDWMDQTSESLVSSKHSGFTGPAKENYTRSRRGHRQLGESSKDVVDTVQASGEENRTDVLDSANSVEDISIGSHDHNNFDLVGEVALKSSTTKCKGDSGPHVENREVNFKQVQVEVCSQEGFNCLPLAKEPLPDSLTAQRGMKNVEVSPTLVTAIDEMMESHHLSSSYPRSPPHYQEDILHRRYNLEEEFMQLSVESYSLASSDSDTSNSDDEYCRFDTSLPEVDHSPKEPESGTMDDHSEMFPSEDTFSDGRHATSHIRRNGRSLFNYCSDQASRIKKILREDHYGMGSDVANVCPLGLFDGVGLPNVEYIRMMFGALELKNDDWLKAKETLCAARETTDGKDFYSALSLVGIVYGKETGTTLLSPVRDCLENRIEICNP